MVQGCVMSERPTAKQLGKEYAKLEKAYAEVSAEFTQALQQMVAALSNPKFYYIDERGRSGNDHSRAMGEASTRLMRKQQQVKKELDKVKKQAWKWYGIAI